ncbi:hypothetical protein LAUMK142_04393 [Mycobacterium pseudokansasii]|uniref:Uncharacterized protein n=1 Tax=Mycobacterium pseudokansasii TaxID=2341080 RepID=A0A498QWK6_9MYCO|nr:hypothetical protein LAUMK142_04393 [Mycobacterium pseudokansasii]
MHRNRGLVFASRIWYSVVFAARADHYDMRVCTQSGRSAYGHILLIK